MKSKTSPGAAIAAAAQKMQRLATTKSAPKSVTHSHVEAPPLEPENVLAWEVLMAMWDQVEAVGGFGLAILGFKYESLRFVFELMVPADRRREVFEQFLLLKPYALAAMRRDGRHSKGSDDSTAGAGRRKRRSGTRRESD